MSRYFAPITEAELKAKIDKAFVDEDPNDPYINRGDAINHQVLLDKLGKDLKVSFDFENFDIEGYRTLPNGMTYLGLQAGGDWEHPVFFIIYWDGKKLRGYVPTEGNPWNTTTKQAYGNDEDADLKNARKRWPDCPDDIDGWFDRDEAEIIKDIQSRILPTPKGLPINKQAVLVSTIGKLPKSMEDRVNDLVYYGDCDEGTELFEETLRLCYMMYGFGDNDKAELLYQWAKEQADASKEWAEQECNDYGTDLKDQPTITRRWGY